MSRGVRDNNHMMNTTQSCRRTVDRGLDRLGSKFRDTQRVLSSPRCGRPVRLRRLVNLPIAVPGIKDEQGLLLQLYNHLPEEFDYGSLVSTELADATCRNLIYTVM